MIDTNAPSGSITVENYVTDDFYSDPTVDLIVNKAPAVKIEAQDIGIGLVDIYYAVANDPLNLEQVKVIKNWVLGDSYIPSADGTYFVYAKLIDKAGNVTYLSSVGIVLDTKLPIVNGIENGKTYCSNVHFTVNEPVDVKVNSTSVGINSNGEYVLFGTARYVVEISDKAGNTVKLNVQVNSTHTASAPMVTLEPTCTKTGTRVMKCTVCDYIIKKESLKALGHDNGEWSTTKKATCTQSGIKIRSCTVCDTVLETVTEQPYGHIRSGWTVTEHETCTKDGKEEIYCLTCLETVELRPIPATGHILGGWVTAAVQTCTEDGLSVRRCLVCRDDLESEVLPKTGHLHSEWITESSATCTEDGMRIKTCKACGETLEEIVTEKLGHRYVRSKCEVCGRSSPVLIITVSSTAIAVLLLIVVYDVSKRRKINRNRP